jgi:hypothetical protein
MPVQSGQPLMAALNKRRRLGNARWRAKVVGIFDAGVERGVMCQIEFATDFETAIVVAPISKISFISNDIDAKRLAGKLRQATTWRKDRLVI